MASEAARAAVAGSAGPPGRMNGHIILGVDPNGDLFAVAILEDERHFIIRLPDAVRGPPARESQPALFERRPLKGSVPGLNFGELFRVFCADNLSVRALELDVGKLASEARGD